MVNTTRKSADLLPVIFRTEKNTKFLSSTIDQLISPPSLNRIDAFVGSKNTPNYQPGDQYLPEPTPLRAAYQLEPGLVVKNLVGEIKKAFGLDDLLNQISNHGGNSTNLDRTLHPRYYSYDPRIDWDKFVNYRDYYWFPVGPSAITITGETKSPLTEFSVTDAKDNIQFLFNGMTTTEDLFLYRGSTYIFNVDSKHNFYIKYTNQAGSADQYNKNITGNGTKNGQVIITIDWTTPDRLFYVSGDDQLSTGSIYVKQPEENSVINIDKEILGKQSYTSPSGVKFLNGMKVRFSGYVFPDSYKDTDFIVEGVGNSITLVRFSELETPDSIADFVSTRFDGTNFDEFPFDNFKNIPIVPEYVTINRASKDLNPWSRYNRWVHADVIKEVAKSNNLTNVVYPTNYRATRPIVEFRPNIQLFNFGNKSIPNVDLIDNSSKNAFREIEGQFGYYSDGILLEEGFRVIFNADQDPLIKRQVFKVKFVVNVHGVSKINLVPESDIIEDGVSTLLKKGSVYGGTSWHYDGNSWVLSQQRTTRNQAPLFDLFDKDGYSYGNTNHHVTNFTGNKLFGYGVGTGTTDPVLGFPLLYQVQGIDGTFLFKNYFSTDTFTLINEVLRTTSTKSTAQTFFKIDGELATVWKDTEDYVIPNTNGVYEVPLNLTNNPMNLPVSSFTFTEISDHVSTMTLRDPRYDNSNNTNNLKELFDISKYGTRLISNLNSLSFAHHFITDQENSVINATRIVGEHYLQFKFNLIRTITTYEQTISPIEGLDLALTSLNQNKTTTFPYYRSDMLPHGSGSTIKTYKVTDSRNTKYGLPAAVNLTSLNSSATLLYLNDLQLVHGRDYTFDVYDANVEILVPLTRNDILVVKYYTTTDGNFVPPTPTKLGLYPAFEPKLFLDDTYATEPVNVIQGHDGSLTVAFNDYRDNILLEFEKRIYNNIKVKYNSDLLDINQVLPGAFRNNEFTYDEIYNPIIKDFLKWKSTYNVEIENNFTFDFNNPRTYNFSNISNTSGTRIPGGWRGIFKLYFDTDKPHTHPWEMLGFSQKPTWWEEEYGPAPYTSDNDTLWGDLEIGRIRQGSRKGIDTIYARPSLSTMLPVDSNGNLVSIRDWGIIGQSASIEGIEFSWKFGDFSPAEVSWRRSSYWPFAVQVLMAIAKPATYASLLFDTSRVYKSIAGNYVYSNDDLFLSSQRVLLPYDTINDQLILTAGYSVFVVETGLIKNTGYLTSLKTELSNSNFNLMNKVGGFVSKDKLEVVIDSVSPNSINPGILLPIEDYSIHFNVSNPVKVLSISGIIVQKSQGKFVVRGYDKVNPYFEIYKPIHQKTDHAITVGQFDEEFIVWAPNVYFPNGQIVSYNSIFYRVVSNHNSGASFDSKYYRALAGLPSVGGTTGLYSTLFESTTTKVFYGTAYTTAQEVIDVIAGYSQWLDSQGFIFDEYNSDLVTLLDWRFSTKEFLFWTTQNWAENSVITLSPFANSIKFEFQQSAVDNVLSSFYDYSLLKADGFSLPVSNFSISRVDNICSITTKGTIEGIYFARLNLVQKEHAIILNNTSRFNDVIYDTETGYRQRRVRLVGFKTADWNGDFQSPGFVYDSAQIQTWTPYSDYLAGDVVEYAGNYYSLDRNLPGTEKFDFTSWNKLGSKPIAQLLPNFDYKINQFEDFYSLDIDNFDLSQQQLAQHLVGYSSRVYLDNIFLNPIAQYKFYQGFIREKGTRNALDKLSKASVHNLNGKIDLNEEWAFRVGVLGAYSSEEELEFPLVESKFVDNDQLIQFVNEKPTYEYDATLYIKPTDCASTPEDYSPLSTFATVSSTFSDTQLVMPVAGYVRADDVDYTLKTKSDLLSFVPGQNIKSGDTFWIGFDDNGDWGVYRYINNPGTIVSASEVNAGYISFKTSIYHKLKVGDIIAVSKFASTLNGIYVIDQVPHLDEFIVKSNKTVPTGSTSYGSIFKFVSSRVSTFDDLASYPHVADFKVNKHIWVDEDQEGKWSVYKKIHNYDSIILNNTITFDSGYYGKRIVSKESNNLFLVSAPSYADSATSGAVYVYTNNNGTISLASFNKINSRNNQYYNNITGSPAKFGHSIDYDSVNGIIVAGAPFASNVKSKVVNGLHVVSADGDASAYTDEGMIVISTQYESNGLEHRYYMLAPEESSNNLNFGYSIFIGNTATSKILLVGAPGADDSAGKIFSYNVGYDRSFDGNTTTITVSVTDQISFTSNLSAPGNRFGELITGDLTGTRIAVSSPGFDQGAGAVSIFQSVDNKTYTSIQNLIWNDNELAEIITTSSNFGSSISMDDSGNWLFVSANNAHDTYLQDGKVIVYRLNTVSNLFEISQVIDNPSPTPGLKFGCSVETDASGEVLGITSLGPTYYTGMTFDNDSTSFDSGSTVFGSLFSNAGTAYLYNRYNNKFVFSEELFNSSVDDNSLYGTAISVNRNATYVSAPLEITTGTIKAGKLFVWNSKDPNSNSWQLIRQQNDLVDTSKIKQVKTIDTFNDTIGSYLDLYDPIKGRISKIADQELRYKTIFDPAVYNTATDNVLVDSSMSWGKEHVGELWWDLSNLKYVWYEQGDIAYRKNIWGNLFPGCSVDIYEWVETTYSPDDWNILTGTSEGLAKSISGTPKYTTSYCTDLVYSSITDTYVTHYYYWVKNTVVVPNRQGRTVSADTVAQLIADPKSAGEQFIQPLSANALSAINIKGFLINERISLNLQIDKITNKNNKHTEWLLIEEGSPDSLPNTLLEKKLFDSLLGRDSLGNAIPDPELSERKKYGIGIRPRQSMFKDRLSAVRNIISYANSIFKDNLIVDFYNLINLNSKDEIGEVPTNEYDKIVEDLDRRDFIVVDKKVQAELSCEITNGRISKINIVVPGFGYDRNEVYAIDDNGTPISWKGPKASIYNDENSSNIETIINSSGSIIDTIILNPGMNYETPPVITVRPYTVIVTVDSSVSNKWSIYSLVDKKWFKIKTQSYNTSLYWDAVDYVSSDYNPYQAISYTVDQSYNLASVSPEVNEYVKIVNGGTGRYLILKKIVSGTSGTYNNEYDVMVSEKGTIRIKDNLWSKVSSQEGWDQVSPFDNTLFDQSGDIELHKILTALKEDIFVGTLKVYWNKLFFAAVKYAFSEQKFLDWAFKTSFIGVHNYAGSLIQRPVYKFQDTKWYEQYLDEIKPYHTQIRDYRLTYDLVEPSNSFVTDFDLPVVYDSNSKKYKSLSLTDSKINDYPYKSWLDNHTLYLESIKVDNGGRGYTSNPDVAIIAAPGDKIIRPATAISRLAGGKIVGFDITDRGEGYTQNPTILLSGGGGSSVVPARVSPVMVNNKIRTNLIGIKFDRISTTREIGTQSVTDTFVADGIQYNYILKFPASLDTSQVVARANGILILSSSYSLEDFNEVKEGYNKSFTRVVMNKQYDAGTVITVSYLKSQKIYSAFDRIQDYYQPVSGMPGKNLEDRYAQLMKGIDYSGTEIQTQGFDKDYSWDNVGFGTVIWDPISGQIEDLDTIYDGGDLTTTTSQTFANAQGINPEDIILDGDTFISPRRTHAPEELIPGHVTDTVGINIFTRGFSGSGLVYTMNYPAIAGVQTVVNLPFIPQSFSGIFVTYNNKILFREETGSTVDTYSVDLIANTITVASQLIDGQINIMLMDIGGTGLLSIDSVIVTSAYQVGALIGSCAYVDVKSVYVSANGVRIGEYTEDASVYYELSETEPGINNRAKITVYGLNPELADSYLIVAGFFSSKFKGFSEIREQIDTTMTSGKRVLELNQPPAKLGPQSTNSIVEVNGRRIIPPNTTYYEITSTSQTIFDISKRREFPANSFDLTMLQVFKNGVEIPILDYHLNQHNNQILFASEYFAVGDVLAICALIDFDYYIHDSVLEITNRVPLDSVPNYVRVITFTNHDSNMMRTEVFVSNSNGIYVLSRKVINDNFVWMSMGNNSLVSGYDFKIMEDGKTIQVDPDFPFVANEQVIIYSITEHTAISTVGFKMFTDPFGRNHFKRLSKPQSTYLSKPLQITDTTIEVEDGNVLDSIHPSSTAPGIIFVAGERIEYLDKTGNVLSKIKRATLGTGAKDYYASGTLVVDQGSNQTIPVSESITVRSFLIDATSSTYLVSSDLKFINPNIASLHDQVEVYYGGRRLEKPTAPGVVRYSSSSDQFYNYDQSSQILDPEFTMSQSLSTSTTTVFVPTFSPTLTNNVISITFNSSDSNVSKIVGGVSRIRGLGLGGATDANGDQPLVISVSHVNNDYTISTSIDINSIDLLGTTDIYIDNEEITRTNYITFGLELTDNIEVMLVQRNGKSWYSNVINSTVSLIDDTSVVASFLKQRQAVEVDQLYYGGDTTLRLDDGTTIVFDGGQSIAGY